MNFNCFDWLFGLFFHFARGSIFAWFGRGARHFWVGRRHQTYWVFYWELWIFFMWPSRIKVQGTFQPKFAEKLLRYYSELRNLWGCTFAFSTLYPSLQTLTITYILGIYFYLPSLVAWQDKAPKRRTFNSIILLQFSRDTVEKLGNHSIFYRHWSCPGRGD